MVDDRGLRRRCEAIFSTLDIPQPFDIRELCRRLGERRRRPLHLAALSLPAQAPCGLFVSTTTFDAIFYQADTTRPHQEHIIGHEIGHLLCHHADAALPQTDALALLMPNLDPAVIQRILARAGYAAEEEREAETIASLISQAAGRPASRQPKDPAPQKDDAIHRIALSLEGHDPTRRR